MQVVAKSSALIISHPFYGKSLCFNFRTPMALFSSKTLQVTFQYYLCFLLSVISVRMMVQFVGKETIYRSAVLNQFLHFLFFSEKTKPPFHGQFNIQPLCTLRILTNISQLQYCAMNYMILTYRHECFTGKYTTC